jgi:hypothetical protein
MVILSFATGTQLFVEPQLVNQASFGLVPTRGREPARLPAGLPVRGLQRRRRHRRRPALIGLVGAVLIVTRTGSSGRRTDADPVPLGLRLMILAAFASSSSARCSG